jgi:putative nucleotidyltransferase with HDIG domain
MNFKIKFQEIFLGLIVQILFPLGGLLVILSVLPYWEVTSHWKVLLCYTILTIVSSFAPIRTFNAALTLNNAITFSGIILYGTWVAVWSGFLEFVIISILLKTRLTRALANGGQVLITVWVVGTLSEIINDYNPTIWFITDLALIIIYWFVNTCLVGIGNSYFRKIEVLPVVRSMVKNGSMSYLLLLGIGDIGARLVGAYEVNALTVLGATFWILRSLFHQYFESLNHLQKKVQENKMLNESFLIAMAASIDARDPYTHGHSYRVAYWGKEIAERLKLPQQKVMEVYYGGILHDIGKIGIEDSILKKEGALTKEEFERIKEHPVIGYEILKEAAVFHDLLPAIRSHHERVDGNGYPDGLVGDEIPLIARILAVSDAFDAMVSDRPYRRGMSVEEALSRIDEASGKQFDPQIAEVFINLIESYSKDELDKILKKHNTQKELILK